MFSDLEVILIMLVSVFVGMALGQVVKIHFRFMNPFKVEVKK